MEQIEGVRSLQTSAKEWDDGMPRGNRKSDLFEYMTK